MTMRLLKGLVELVVDDVGFEGGAVLEDRNGGNVGEGLGDDDVVVVERAGFGAKQVEGADDLTPQAHRDGLGGAESG